MEVEIVCEGGGGENSVSRGENGGLCGNNGSYLVWKDLTVTVIPSFGNVGAEKKVLLQGLNGYAEPGRIMAIMGPSGSGKSTLLDCLAGRLLTNTIMSGNIFLNGKKCRPNNGAPAAYVTQKDILLGTLTVKETITYSANLRMPTAMSKAEINEIVEETIMTMGLEDCADTLIGIWGARGISGGERKRVSIALELITKPPLLFLDEPTSGLDGASAFFIVHILKSLARDGRSVISSIHQPSSEVFAAFDDLFLLSGGETVYFGEAKMALQFFAKAGVPCPSRRNPSDHFLRCVNSDFDVVTATLKDSNKYRVNQNSDDPLVNMAAAEIKHRLVESYKRSNYAKHTRRRIQELSSATEGVMPETQDGTKASWVKQLGTLTRRSVVNMSRDIGYYWLRLVIYVVVSICVGILYYRIGLGHSNNAMLARISCMGFVFGFMTFMSIGGFPSFIEEMKIYYRERQSGHYGVSVYILSNSISSFPFLMGISLASAPIVYFMVELHPGFSHYAYFCLLLFSCISAVESLMMLVASLVPNFLMGVLTGSGLIGIMMMTAGFFRKFPELPKPFWRYPVSYLSYGAWAVQGGGKNDFIGLEFDPEYPGDPIRSGTSIINTIYGISTDHSKWWDLAALYSLSISYRLLFFVIQKFIEKAMPLLRIAYTKHTLQRLDKQPCQTTSFDVHSKAPSFRVHSKRHVPQYSLSAQEGLSSPIQ